MCVCVCVFVCVCVCLCVCVCVFACAHQRSVFLSLYLEEEYAAFPWLQREREHKALLFKVPFRSTQTVCVQVWFGTCAHQDPVSDGVAVKLTA